MSLMAGAEQRSKNYAVAAYYHSIVFDKCWSRRLSSKRDFYIDNDTIWQQCLNLCKNEHEKKYPLVFNRREPIQFCRSCIKRNA
jgi:hypothetical protein